MDKNGNITLSYDTWKNGIKTPLTGMGDIVNIDIFDKPGVAKIDFLAQEVIGEADITDASTSSVECCSIDSSGNAIFGTSEGDVLRIAKAAGTLSQKVGASAAEFQHAVEWKGYTLFATYDSSLNRMELSAYSDALAGDNIEYSFVTMPNNSLASGSGDYRFSRGAICVGTDDVVYLGSGRYVGSLTEDTTFSPTDGGTYTWNNQALDLPSGFEIDSMINFNDYLLIFAGNPNTREQLIFPWDRTSASFDYPTPLNNGVASQAIVINNLAYFLDGTRGQFKVTNRSAVNQIAEFENITYPDRTDGLAQKPGAIANIDDVIFVGVSNDEDGVAPIGVYKIKGGAYTRQTLSEGLDGSTKEIRVHFVKPFKYNNYLVSWHNVDDGTFGVDEFGLNGYRVSSYGAYMESLLYGVGSVVDKKSYTQLDVSLAKELATGEGVRIKYRENLTDDWTTIATFDFATYGAVSQLNTTAKITDVSTVQIRVELTTGANSTTTPELIAVNLF